MENVEDDVDYQSLIIQIFKQAISDAIQARNPKKPKYKKHNINKNLSRLKRLLIFSIQHQKYIESKKMLFNLMLILLIEKIIDGYQNKFVSEHSPKMHKAYYARLLLTDKNKYFCMYANLLGLDPEFLSEKINKELKLFDKKRKNILKKSRSEFDIIKK